MRLTAVTFFALAFLSLAAIWGLSVVLATAWHPTLGVIGAAALAGYVPWAICGLVVMGTKRPFGLVDAIRCTGWILIGGSEGMREVANSQARVFYPQLVPVANGCSAAGVLVGLLTIVLATLLLPKPSLPLPGHCGKCGYDLTGNASGVCPECGERI